MDRIRPHSLALLALLLPALLACAGTSRADVAGSPDELHATNAPERAPWESDTSTLPSQEPDHRMHLVVIMVDDLGYADLGFLPQVPPDVRTPHIDRIAASGTYFRNAYATAPICSPSRCGMITGRHQARWGNYWYGEGGLPATEATLPQMLGPRGYAAKKIGKTHLNGGPAQHPLDHGFDSFLGFVDHTHDYLRLSRKDVEAYGEKEAKQAHIGPLTRDRELVSYENRFTTDIFTDEAIEFIRRDHGDDAFYLQLEYNAVHHPTYVCHPDYLERFGIEQFPFWDPNVEPYKEWHAKWGHLGAVDPDGRRRYLSQLAVLDDGVGRVLDAIDEAGLTEQTLVIFLSDNGGTINTYANNAPLGGYKYMFGEGGIRIPLIVSWPGHLPGGKTVDQVVSAMDIVPTVLELAGVPEPDNLDGKSLLPLLTDRASNIPHHEALFWSDGRDSWVVRRGPWKLCHEIGWTHLNFKIVDGQCVRDPNEYVYPSGTLLFNLDADIGETTNVAARHPRIVAELTALYNAWRAQMSAPRTGDGKLKGK